VRLVQGSYGAQLDYDVDPAEVARGYADAGATLVHVVDLDGARDGARTNRDQVARIVEAAGVKVELGGGIRSTQDVRAVLAAGAAYAILGTMAAEQPEALPGLVVEFGGRIVLGLDVADGLVVVRGWRESSRLTAIELARRAVDAGLRRAIYTDVSRDGMLEGPDSRGAAELASETGLQVTASGGVGTLDHVRDAAAHGVHSLIIGRALFEGRFTVADAIAAARAA
jgi:phosphoribosylformimino-5-aminoimidazole carboxamide ribotide isomerase